MPVLEVKLLSFPEGRDLYYITLNYITSFFYLVCNYFVFLFSMQDHLKALSDLEGKLDELNGWGQLLVKECVVPDGEVIQERLDSLKQQCDTLTSTASERQAALEESLLSLGQFEGAYDDLWAWLLKANKQLENFEPITGDPDAVAAQLAKHKVSYLKLTQASEGNLVKISYSVPCLNKFLLQQFCSSTSWRASEASETLSGLYN